jgi:hypothetical protein
MNTYNQIIFILLLAIATILILKSDVIFKNIYIKYTNPKVVIVSKFVDLNIFENKKINNIVIRTIKYNYTDTLMVSNSVYNTYNIGDTLFIINGSR